MRRATLYIPATGFLLALVVLVVSITATRPPWRPCPHCASKDVTIVTMLEKTAYHCNQCFHVDYGPPAVGFSWMDAAREWLGE